MAQALLDEVELLGEAEAVVGLVLEVLQRRATSTQRLAAAIAARSRLRHRALLEDLVGQADEGVQSRLEFRYRRDVERAHGLPRGERNIAEPGARSHGARSHGAAHSAQSHGAQVRYRDVRYRRFRLIVELDGEKAHPAHRAWRDRRRDNDAALEGELTFRYGWREVVGGPCETATQVVLGLRHGGWTGSPHTCGPRCTLSRTA